MSPGEEHRGRPGVSKGVGWQETLTSLAVEQIVKRCLFPKVCGFQMFEPPFPHLSRENGLSVKVMEKGTTATIKL